MNNAPFRVGQRVVAVMSGENEHGEKIIEGHEYIIKRINRCLCGKWSVDVGIPAHRGKHSCTSRKCNRELVSGIVWVCYKYFAPIPPRSIEIPESLKEQAEEMKDLAETIAPMKKELV